MADSGLGSKYFPRPPSRKDDDDDEAERLDRAVTKLFRPDAAESKDQTPEAVVDTAIEFISKRLAAHRPAAPARVAASLDAVLKPYQREGVAWLLAHLSAGLGCVLADEMGLGKTIQTLVSLHTLALEGPVLVITPLSVVQTWLDEIGRWLPPPELASIGKAVQRYCGGRAERDAVLDEIASMLQSEGCHPTHSHPVSDKKGSDGRFTPRALRFVITTPEMVLSDRFFFRSVAWSALVFDEAHRVRNSETKLYKCLLLDMSSVPLRILLTGTPLHNHPQELLALMSLSNPAIFKGVERAVDPLAMKEDGWKRRMEALASLLLLRRLKRDVLKDLPSLSEMIIHCPLSPLQRAIYTKLLAKNVGSVLEMRGGSKLSLMNTVLQLRKCCNHPYMFDGVEKEPYALGEHIVLNSAKLCYLDKLLHHLKHGHHRVLIFSQFTHMLDILQDYMFFRKFSCVRLDGSVRGDERFEAVSSFQRTEDVFVFLLSTRAGGVGLTLTGADTVIFYDSDWNPQMDLQAQQRVHRIGQEKPVSVYRLVAQQTIEDAILKRAQQKLRLAEEILNDGNAGGETAQSVRVLIQAAAACCGGASSEADDPDSVTREWESRMQRITAQDILRTAQRVSFTEAVDSFADDVYSFDGVAHKKAIAEGEHVLKRLQSLVFEDGPVATGELGKKAGDDSTMLPHPQRAKLTEVERVAKLQPRWEKAGYTSHAVVLSAPPTGPDTMGVEGEPEEVEELVGAVHHLIGDVLHPSPTKPANQATAGAQPTSEEQYIVIPVNNSGVWGRGGLFDAVGTALPQAPAIYEQAKQLSDLRLGDAHLFRFDPPDGRQLALAVVIRSSNGEFDVSALGKSLERLRCVAEANRRSGTCFTTFHFPQLGGGQRDVLYAAEKVIKKVLAPAACFIYYYDRRRERGAARARPIDGGPSSRPAKRSRDADQGAEPPFTAPGVGMDSASPSRIPAMVCILGFDPSEARLMQRRVLLRGSIGVVSLEEVAGENDAVAVVGDLATAEQRASLSAKHMAVESLSWFSKAFPSE